MNFKELSRIQVAHPRTGKPVLCFVMEAILTFPGGSSAETCHVMVDLAQRFHALFPARLTRFQKHMATRMSPISGDEFARYYHELADSIDRQHDPFSVHLSESSNPPETALEGLCRDVETEARAPESNLTIRVPLDWFEDHTETFLEFTRDAASALGASKGVAGVAPSSEYGTLPKYADLYWPFFARYPGLHHDKPTQMAQSTPATIGNTNWITLISEAHIEALGGREALIPQLGAQAQVTDYEGGIMIRAGAMPELGDNNRGLVPEAYIPVARALAPLRFKDYPSRKFGLIAVPAPLDHYEETMRWIARFDEKA